MDIIEARGGLWRLAHGRSLDLDGRAHIMGILNVTPDSFSDGGRYDTVDAALEQAFRMIEEGASIVDIGGESTRPGATPVEASEERARILPVIEALSARSDCLISVDTYRAGTAEAAIAAGAHIVNDVWGAQFDGRMAKVAAKSGAGFCLMHTGRQIEGRERDILPDVIDDQIAFLGRSLELAREAGVEDARIVLDPGFGFAKDGPHNMILMDRFAELKALGYPLLVGTSRKRFVRGVLGRADPEPDIATAVTSALLRERGADIFRVHDVAANRNALAIADAMLRARRGEVW